MIAKQQSTGTHGPGYCANDIDSEETTTLRRLIPTGNMKAKQKIATVGLPNHYLLFR